MPMIDRYEMSIPSHMRLIDARSALNVLERFVQEADGHIDRDALTDKLEPLIDALSEAADAALPVDSHEAFNRWACELGYIALSPKEAELIQDIRRCTEEGQEDIYRMVEHTQETKGRVFGQ